MFTTGSLCLTLPAYYAGTVTPLKLFGDCSEENLKTAAGVACLPLGLFGCFLPFAFVVGLNAQRNAQRVQNPEKIQERNDPFKDPSLRV